MVTEKGSSPPLKSDEKERSLRETISRRRAGEARADNRTPTFPYIMSRIRFYGSSKSRRSFLRL